MSYLVNVAELRGLMDRLDGSDESTAAAALEQVVAIPEEDTRIGLLEHAARNCGAPKVAEDAFEQMRQALVSHPAESRAGQWRTSSATAAR